ncbi:MAG: hypothetical protein AB7S75_09135 [Desulfococcaceae bacterium]
MKSVELKKQIRNLSELYAVKRNTEINSSYETAVIFLNIKDNFFSESFESIEKNEIWKQRLTKRHPNVKDTFEMQSSNSSDALLMNIFCHPKISSWKSILNIFNVSRLNPQFGFKAELPKINGIKDKTEIDIAFEDIFAEAKLTEDDFTQKEINIVQEYQGFSDFFDTESLPIRKGKYLHYQIIRNLLAARYWQKRHFLLCDDRRSDLVRSYCEIVSCIKDTAYRTKYKVLFWQEICSSVGQNLKQFLKEKYGIMESASKG